MGLRGDLSYATSTAVVLGRAWDVKLQLRRNVLSMLWYGKLRDSMGLVMLGNQRGRPIHNPP